MAEAENTVEVRLIGMGDKTVTVAIDRSCSVHQLKRKVQEDMGLSESEQRILQGATELQNDASLSDVVPAEAATVELSLVVSLPPEMTSWAQFFEENEKAQKEKRFAQARTIAAEMQAAKEAGK
mmetsp:Transcript_17251/g.39037  ORF Transcript_17251/g.39037 Transcript_17251/m.39037 type:complete len:124 (+) Transcript_17251:83-454(+)